MKIHLKQIIEAHELDEDKLAALLFPTVAFPSRALGRVIKEGVPLNADQVWALAGYIGCTTDALYTESGWSSHTQGNVMTCIRGHYQARIDTATGACTVYRGAAPVEKLLFCAATPFSEFIEKLNKVVEGLQATNN